MQGTTHPRNETLLPSDCLIPLRITHYLVWNPSYALLPHSTQFSFHLEAKIVNKQTYISMVWTTCSFLLILFLSHTLTLACTSISSLKARVIKPPL